MASMTVVGGPRVRSGETCTALLTGQFPLPYTASSESRKHLGEEGQRTALCATSLRVVGGCLTSQSSMAALSMALSRGASDISFREVSSVWSDGTG